MEAITVLVVDKRAIVSTGIALILETYADFQVVGQARTGEELFQYFNGHAPEVVCMDIELPGSTQGLDVLRRLHRFYPKSRVVILTNLLEPSLFREALREGVLGYLGKDVTADELAEAIRAAHQGLPMMGSEAIKLLVKGTTTPETPSLTERERQVMERVARGLSNQQIGEELHISLSTVQFHVSHILQKLAVHNRIEATAFAVRHNLASFPED